MAATTAAVPGVMWAQRPKLLFLTLDVSDCTEPDIKLEKDSLHFRGQAGPEAKHFEITMKFLKEIDPEKSKFAVRPRSIEFALG
jgi:prostaglandin-E synthase